jgi:hypothetical protein
MSGINDEALKQMELAEKKKRRLERNRASARECRKRKKEKKLMLRQQLAHLEADNLQLRLKLKVGKENATSSSTEKSAVITAQLDEMINQGVSESEIVMKLQELKERFSDYGRDRRSAIDFHVNQVRRCLQPTQTTKAILWIMSLAPKFHNITTGNASNAIPPGSEKLIELWQDLLRDVQPDAMQRQLMISYTTAKDGGIDPFEEIERVSTSCNQILDRIVDIIYTKNAAFDSEMADVQSVLSPTQIAKFILWIDRNPACMQMLEALWPHLTSSAATTTAAAASSSSNAQPSSSSTASAAVKKPSRSISRQSLEEDSEDDNSSDSN